MKQIILALIFSLTFTFTPKLYNSFVYNNLNWTPEQSEWESVNELIVDIKDKYNINIHLYEESNDFFKERATSTCVYYYDYTEDILVKTLKEYDKALSKYNDYGLSLLPRDFFVFSRIDYEKYQVDGQVVKGPTTKIMELSTWNYYKDFDGMSNTERTLHHEIFHNVKPDEDFLKEFESIDEYCFQVSDYACSSIKEELSETWANSFTNQDLEKYQLIQDVYGDILLK